MIHSLIGLLWGKFCLAECQVSLQIRDLDSQVLVLEGLGIRGRLLLKKLLACGQYLDHAWFEALSHVRGQTLEMRLHGLILGAGGLVCDKEASDSFINWVAMLLSLQKLR
jgi:hypothetical protein